jgi:hypothetical protein
MTERPIKPLVEYAKAIEQAKAAREKRQWTAWQACLLDFVAAFESAEQRIKELERERNEALDDKWKLIKIVTDKNAELLTLERERKEALPALEAARDALVWFEGSGLYGDELKTDALREMLAKYDAARAAKGGGQPRGVIPEPFTSAHHSRRTMAEMRGAGMGERHISGCECRDCECARADRAEQRIKELEQQLDDADQIIGMIFDNETLAVARAAAKEVAEPPCLGLDSIEKDIIATKAARAAKGGVDE